MMTRSKSITFLLISLILISGCSRILKPAEYSRTEPVMGTYAQIKVIGVSAPGKPRYSRIDLRDFVDETLEVSRSLEKRFSSFDPDSEINLLNYSKERKVSKELYGLLEKSKYISRKTYGKFDVTVAPVLKADGFYKDMPEELLNRIPDGFGGINWKNITLKIDGRTILLRNGAWVDLSGIAKGYIADKMADLLKEKGLLNIMINAGGDIYCGEKPGNEYWKIGIRKPGKDDIVLTLKIRNKAVATSGDYENVVIDEATGQVLSHIIDPATDKALPDLQSSITVIADECWKADALATGMMAMGRENAIRLADELEDVEIIVVESSGSEDKISFSKGAKQYVLGR